MSIYMPKPFDATIKDLAAQGPANFVRRFDGPTTQPVELLAPLRGWSVLRFRR